MRTKHLLYTMALASVFAACTQDEFVTEGGNSNPLEGRKSLGKITLVEAEGPSTRWTVDNFNTFSPEVGDGFSYLLVDEPLKELAGQHDYPIDDYKLVDHIHTNYVFKFNGTGWDNEANLVEGNYLLVGPAQNVQSRKPVEVTLPAEQTLTLGADGKVDPLSALEEYNESKYPVYIGHRFLSEGSKANNKLPRRNFIFAFPEITVKNSAVAETPGAPRVAKVVLKRTKGENNNTFIVNAPINNMKAAELLTNEWFAQAGTDDKDQYVVGAWEARMNEYLGVRENDDDRLKQASNNAKVNAEEIPATATYEIKDRVKGAKAWKTFKYNGGLYGKTSELLGTPTSTTQYIVINMPGNGVELRAGESFKFNAVIPADTYVMSPDDEDLTIYAVLSNGDVYKKIMDSRSEVSIYPGKRYPDQDYSGMTVKPAVGTNGLPGRGEYFTIDIYEGATDGVSKYEKCDPSEVGELGVVGAVKSTEDLIAIINANSSTRVLNITVEGKNVVYNEKVNSEVANTECQKINILGHIKIDGGEKGLTISNKVSFEDAAIDKGAIVFNSTTATLGTVLVSKNATFELRNAAQVEDKSTANIYNVGTLKLYTDKFAKVYNYAALDVYTNLLEKETAIHNGYEECGDQSEIISDPINLIPEVTVKAESKEIYGQYQIRGELNYPIVVERLNKDVAGFLKLIEDVRIVKVEGDNTKNGSITNNGVIGKNGWKKTLTVANGFDGATLINEKDGVIWNKVIIEGASHKLTDLPVDAKLYKAAAQVTNNGTMQDAQIDGLLTMGADSRLEGTLSMTAGYNGEIDNTAKGTIVNDPSTQGIVVFANIPGMNLTSAEAIAATSADFKAYTATTRVTVARLTDAVVMGNNIDDNEIGFRHAEAGLITELEFAEGSSLTIGEGEFKTNLRVTVSYENIQWTGRTRDASKFALNGENNSKKKFVKIVNNQATAVEGNVVFNNCEEIADLK